MEFRLAVKDSTHVNVCGDVSKLQQILRPLIDNAIKFTEAPGLVEIRACADLKDENSVELKLEILDTGIGIPDEMIEKIFEPFSQADGSLTRRHGGVGLGLSISACLSDLMSGQISIDSKLGEGTTVKLCLPLERDRGDSLIYSREILRKQLRSLGTIDQLDPPKIDRRNCKVMLVESNSANRMLQAQVLEQAGFEVIQALNEKDAVQLLGTEKVNIIIMDYAVPSGDALRDTKSIRRHEKGSSQRTPIVALAATSVISDSKSYIEKGFDGLITKPVSPQSLISTIEKFVISDSEDETLN